MFLGRRIKSFFSPACQVRDNNVFFPEMDLWFAGCGFQVPGCEMWDEML